jgi:hypothetical protein
VEIYKVITKRQVQKVRVISSRAREDITEVIIKKVRRFSNSNKRLR